MASVNVFYTLFIKPKGKGVLQVSLVSESVGDRASGYELAKDQLFREVDDSKSESKTCRT